MEFYSVLANEVTSYNVDELSLCIRFIDKERSIRKEFLTFSKLERITGEAIAKSIIKSLEEVGLLLDKIRGQGYDGASNMASGMVGVQARIRQYSPFATFIHCSGHSLNLVISSACSETERRTVIDKINRCCPKRTRYFENFFQNNFNTESSKRKPFLDLYTTRWAARHTA